MTSQSLVIGLLFALILNCQEILHVSGFSSGAPSSTCDSMIPRHGGSSQTPPSPYVIKATPTHYHPGDTINVTVDTVGGATPFNGFLLEAMTNQNKTVGKFQPVSGTKPVCGPNNDAGLTHDGSSPTTRLDLTWTAPSKDEGDIVFKGTFVQDMPTYWVGVMSNTIFSSLTTTPGKVPRQTTVKPSSGQDVTKFQKTADCQVKKGCFGDCDNSGCTHLVSWQNLGNQIELTIEATFPQPGDHWMAVGFSSDDKMGSDSVVECVTVGDITKAFHSYNEGINNVQINDPKDSLVLVRSSINNRYARCTVLRNKTVAGADFRIFDLTKPWRLMFAQGPAQSGWSKLPHAQPPSVSGALINLQDIDTDVAATAVSNTLVKVHGCIMTVVWMLTAELGIVLARYFKPMWPNKTILSLKVWFQIHRACMVITLLGTAAAFIIIFIDVGGYSQVFGEWHLNAHPVIGIIATALCVINPIMALFRPGPNTPKRPLFNWAHATVGYSADVLSVVNLVLGVLMTRARTPYAAVYVLATYIAWVFAVLIVLEIAQRIGEGQEKKFSDIQLRSKDEEEKKPPEEPQNSKLKHACLAVHCLVITGLTLAVVILIAIN